MGNSYTPIFNIDSKKWAIDITNGNEPIFKQSMS